MYISGENIVVKPYTPVDAYAVMPMADGITSGGNGDGNVIVGRTRFYWVYNPDPMAPNGFTGAGWFCDIQNTPLYGIPEAELRRQFATGERTDLNKEFEAWQILVNNQPDGADYVGNLIDLIYSNKGSKACYNTNA